MSADPASHLLQWLEMPAEGLAFDLGKIPVGLSPGGKRPAQIVCLGEMLVTRDITFIVYERFQQDPPVDVLNSLLRATGTGVPKPDVCGQKILFVEQDRAVTEPMVEVVPQKVTQQPSLLGVIGESEMGEVAWDIRHES